MGLPPKELAQMDYYEDSPYRDPDSPVDEANNMDEDGSSPSSSPSRQESESRQPSVEDDQDDQEYTEMNTANVSSFGDEHVESPLRVAELRNRLSNAKSRIGRPSFLGFDGTGETPLETSKAPSEYGEDEPVADGEGEFEAEEHSMDVDRRIKNLWNVHDARKITFDYGGEKEGLDALWKKQFGDRPRPKAYTAEVVPKGEFLPATDPDVFIEMMKNPESKSTEELYALTANVANVLKSWQDEHIAIGELLAKHAKDTKIKHPKYLRPENPVAWEDKKEAMLYGYPHATEKKKGMPDLKRGMQDAFLQGGFKATPAQQKRMLEEAGDSNNYDGWEPIIRNKQPLVPAMRSLDQDKPKKAVEIKYETSGVGDMGMKKEDQSTPAETDVESQRPTKRQTRSHVGKETATPAEQFKTEPTEPAETQTAPPSPPRRGRPRTSKARPRGRPSAANKASTTQASPNKPPPTPIAPASTHHPSSDPGPDIPEKSSSSTRSKRPIPASHLPPPHPHLAQPPSDIHSSDSTASIPPTSTSNKPPTSTTTATTTTTTTTEQEDEDNALLTPAQLKKIAESDNPARTRAMILHWVKFRKDGRQRKPKRTKAEIEADRAANAQNEGNGGGESATASGSTTPKKVTEMKKGPGKPGRPPRSSTTGAGASASAASASASASGIVGQPDIQPNHQDHLGHGHSHAHGHPQYAAPGHHPAEHHHPSYAAGAPVSSGHATFTPANMPVGQHAQQQQHGQQRGGDGYGPGQGQGGMPPGGGGSSVIR
ncbi:hypothetical protein FQN54_000251 [Arachnomyces sp. PD_36]|nr:hypothetical protein FQN54_000251 [Arachnomyces sp. PD_36]